MKWLHVPRSGSSFVNVVTHHPGICPEFPQEVVLIRGSDSEDMPEAVQELMAENSSIRVGVIGGNEFNHSSWKVLCHDNLQAQGHRTIGGGEEEFAPYDGKTVLMMRQPEERLLSAYDVGKMGCTMCENEIDFAPTVAGCATKMLARSGEEVGTPCLQPCDPPTKEEMELATERLLHHTAFVGIVEEWELSICLFHSVFGGKCNKLEVVNVHPNPNSTNPGNHDLARLGGFVDPYDGPLYNVALGLFWARVQEHNLTREGCSMMCS